MAQFSKNSKVVVGNLLTPYEVVIQLAYGAVSYNSFTFRDKITKVISDLTGYTISVDLRRADLTTLSEDRDGNITYAVRDREPTPPLVNIPVLNASYSTGTFVLGFDTAQFGVLSTDPQLKSDLPPFFIGLLRATKPLENTLDLFFAIVVQSNGIGI